MRKNALLATLAFAAVALANGTAPGIEVLGIEVLGCGTTIVSTKTANAPTGSYVEGVMVVNGQEAIIDSGPAGLTTIVFPCNLPGNRVDLRGPTGVLLASDWADGVSFD